MLGRHTISIKIARKFLKKTSIFILGRKIYYENALDNHKHLTLFNLWSKLTETESLQKMVKKILEQGFSCRLTIFSPLFVWNNYNMIHLSATFLHPSCWNQMGSPFCPHSLNTLFNWLNNMLITVILFLNVIAEFETHCFFIFMCSCKNCSLSFLLVDELFHSW